jgi:NOL1/NOP2/sun family putative RNA methylase
MKNELKERLKELMNDFKDFKKTIKKKGRNIIRVNKIKISEEKLEEKLKRWNAKKILKGVFEIKNLKPGELGKAKEHLLGYYFIQDLASLMPVLALNPKPNELILDLTAAPGGKTTFISEKMYNKGTVIANDFSNKRNKILIHNLNRCGCSNVIVTKEDGKNLCKKLGKLNIKFDKILIDPSCSEEGTIRENKKILRIWNENKIKKFSKEQKRLTSSSIKILKKEGRLVYSTCTYSPEENEEVVNNLIENYGMKIDKISLPVKTRPGVIKWRDKKFNKDVGNAIRIYPQDNNTGGFFIAKLKNEKRV